MAKWLSPAPFTDDRSSGYAPRLYPNVVRKWEISDDSRVLTLHLRRGMKWSDGMPVTADDFLFWYDRVLLNETLTPDIPARYRSADQPMHMQVIDQFTVKYTFADPKPDVVFQWAPYRVLAPKHHFAKFHIDNNPDADDDAHANGYGSWSDRFILYYGDDHSWLYYAFPGTPIIDTFLLLYKDSDLEKYERNPYYWKIDPDGKQLPYADHLVIPSHPDYGTLLLQTISGELDVSILHIEGLGSLREEGDSGGYRILQWRNDWMSTPLAITLNYTHPDPDKRRLFNSLGFRKALSLAIDRDEMSRILYSGLSEPWTPSVPPHWTGFESWMSTYYANHDAARANELLDDIGLRTNADGLRILPDGRTLTIRGAFEDRRLVSAVELIQGYWADIGVSLEVYHIERSARRQSFSEDNLDARLAHTGGGAEVCSIVALPHTPHATLAQV